MIGKSGIAVRKIQRAPAAAVAQLAKFGVATIHEAMGRTGLLAPVMRPVYPGARVCGTVAGTLANWKTGILGAFAAARRHADSRFFARAPSRPSVVCPSAHGRPDDAEGQARRAHCCGLKRRTYTAAS